MSDVRRGNDESAAYVINKLPIEWQPYAKRYWSHLAENTKQPDYHDFDITAANAQQVRIKLAGLV